MNKRRRLVHSRWARAGAVLLWLALVSALVAMPSWAASPTWQGPGWVPRKAPTVGLTLAATLAPTATATTPPTATPTPTATATQTPAASTPAAVPASGTQGSALPESSEQRLARIGLGVLRTNDVRWYLNSVPVGWYLDWIYRRSPVRPEGVEYIQVLPVEPGRYPPSWSAVRAAVRANLGAIWIVGNEPESIYKGKRTPEKYAEIYHAYYTFIKDVDPTAQIMNGGVVEPTPLRLQWLDRVLATYESKYGGKMPVDIWNTHNMTLREKKGEYGADIPVGIDAQEGMLYEWWQQDDMEIFEQHVVDFRRWMKAHGEQNKPFFITEYGFLYPSVWFDALGEPGGDARCKMFMTNTFEYLLETTDEELGYPADGNRLVQRWAWYSMNGPRWEQNKREGFNGNLYWYGTRRITVFGEHYKELLAEILGE